MEIEKNHLFEQIHKLLWEKIRSGEIVPGQRLKDIEWAQRLGVSRTPVREAMRKMQQEGVLIPLAQGGYEVRGTSRRDLVELYRCRAALEALATEDAAARAGAAEVERLEKLVKQCDDAIAVNDLDAAFAHNSAFHKAIVDLSGNAHLQGLLDSLQKLVFFYRSALLKMSKDDAGSRALYVERLRVKQDRHRAILAAVRVNDAARAGALMRDHVRETAEDLLPAVPDTGVNPVRAEHRMIG
ncbi:MAG: GntR family transcriptional regulator [Burkholderiales bacterium]|nr:GntR family transcriptional regulator [Burkholderiales bacterium]